MPPARKQNTHPGNLPADPAKLLAWYDRHRRVLPWRALPGQTADPYRVWLSEIMLQQTTVATVGPYFTRFLERWPSVGSLAAAPLDDVLTEWAGLGYYARARNLHACAQAVVERHGGQFPSAFDDLRALPGIGAYTAGAIASIAFNARHAAIDGNAERVLARLYRVETPLPAAKPELQRLGLAMVPEDRPGDFAQAMIDLGSTICTPRKPRCVLCPWRDDCQAAAAGIQEELPRKTAKAERPKRYGMAFWVVDGTGAILLRKRAPKGLLGGMMEVPSTDWTGTPPDENAVAAAAPVTAEWRMLPGHVRHVFTHFELTLGVAVARVKGTGDPKVGVWVMPDALGGYALPSLMKKVAQHALRTGT